MSALRHRRPDRPTARRAAARRAAAAAGRILAGIGLGGFLDGIVLHQLLQWHHLLTSTGEHPAGTVSGLEANTLADGFFIWPRGSASRRRCS